MSTTINMIGISGGIPGPGVFDCSSKQLRATLTNEGYPQDPPFNPETGVLRCKVKGGTCYMVGGKENVAAFIADLEAGDALYNSEVSEMVEKMKVYEDVGTWWFFIDW